MRTHYPTVWLPSETELPRDAFTPMGLTAMDELLEGNFQLIFREAIDLMPKAVARIRFAFTTFLEAKKDLESDNYVHELIGIDDAFTQVTDGQIDFNRVDLSTPFDAMYDANIELFFDTFGIRTQVGKDKSFLSNEQMYKYVNFSPVGVALETEDTGCQVVTFHFIVVANAYIRHQDILNVYSDPGEYVFEETEEHEVVSNLTDETEVGVVIEANRLLIAFLRERGVSRFDRTDVMETVE